MSKQKKQKINPLRERTLVLIKPDAIARGLIGDVLSRFEKRGLKIIGLKLVKPPLSHIKKHFPGTKQWIEGMGKKTLETYVRHGKNPKKEIGTDDPYKIGKMIEQWGWQYLSSGPVVAVALEGLHAISVVRKLIGNTVPSLAESGTIRGDFSVDSPVLANYRKRSLKNIIHASGDEKEARHELRHWFLQKELCDHERTDHMAMF